MTKPELLAVILILLGITVVAGFNFSASEVKARDVQRKNDVSYIGDALKEYREDFRFYPKSVDSKILGCGSGLDFFPCEWGNPIGRLRDPDFGGPLPQDPLSSEGYRYVYLSNRQDIQVLGHLERKDTDEYNEDIEERGIMCGTKVCNFGLTNKHPSTLSKELDIPLLDYDATESAILK